MKNRLILNNFKIISCYAVILLSFLMGSVENISASDTLRICTLELAPFGITAEDGKNSGLLYDISNLIAEEAGFSQTNTIAPFVRIIKLLEAGKIDFSLFLRSEKNDAFVIPVLPIFDLDNVVIGLKGTVFDSLESLQGKKVARIRDARYDKRFDADDLIRKYETTNYIESIILVVRGRVDAMIGTELGLLYDAKKMGYKREVFGKPLVLNTKKVWLLYSKKAADEVKIKSLKLVCEKLIEEGKIQKLIEKYTKFDKH